MIKMVHEIPTKPILVQGYECLRCGHKWVPKMRKDTTGPPALCPQCRSPYWNRPRKAKAR